MDGAILARLSNRDLPGRPARAAERAAWGRVVRLRSSIDTPADPSETVEKAKVWAYGWPTRPFPGKTPLNAAALRNACPSDRRPRRPPACPRLLALAIYLGVRPRGRP